MVVSSIGQSLVYQSVTINNRKASRAGNGPYADRDDDNKSQRAEDRSYPEVFTSPQRASALFSQLVINSPYIENPNGNPDGEVFPTRNWVDDRVGNHDKNEENQSYNGWNRPVQDLRPQTKIIQSPGPAERFFNSIVSPVKDTTRESMSYYGPIRHNRLEVEETLNGIGSPVKISKMNMPMTPMEKSAIGAMYKELSGQNSNDIGMGSMFSPGVGAMIGRVTGSDQYVEAQISHTPIREGTSKWQVDIISSPVRTWNQDGFPEAPEMMTTVVISPQKVHPGGGYVKLAASFPDPIVGVPPTGALVKKGGKSPGFGGRQMPLVFPSIQELTRQLANPKPKTKSIERNTSQTRSQSSMNQKLKDLWTSGSSKSTSPTAPQPLNEMRPVKSEEHQVGWDQILKHDEPATVRMVKDARGSRQVQDALDRSSDVERHRLFGKLVNHTHELCTDQFGHYVIQKFFLLGTEPQKRQMVKQLKGNFIALAKHNIGCRVMQRAAGHLCKNDFLAVVEELAPVSAELSRDTSASHVLQKLLERHESLVVARLMPGMQGKFVALCKESFSCRIVQRLLELRDDGIRKSILKEVMTAVYPLSKQEFGNYIIQHVIKHFNNAVVKKIYKQLHPHMLELATNKFSSNVLEHLYLKGCNEVQGSLVHMVCSKDFLDTCVRDRFGNYFIQIILGSSINAHRRALANVLKERYGSNLEEMQYGKYIAMKLAKLKITPERPNNKNQKRRTSAKKDEKTRRGW